MKFLSTPLLLLILLLAFVYVKMGMIPSEYEYLVSLFLIVIGIFLSIKLILAYKAGRITTASNLFKIGNFSFLSKADNTIIGNTFERDIDPKKFNSAFRSSLYIAIIFLVVGLLMFLNLV
jgi:hypothetical protein